MNQPWKDQHGPSRSWKHKTFGTATRTQEIWEWLKSHQQKMLEAPQCKITLAQPLLQLERVWALKYLLQLRVANSPDSLCFSRFLNFHTPAREWMQTIWMQTTQAGERRGLRAVVDSRSCLCSLPEERFQQRIHCFKMGQQDKGFVLFFFFYPSLSK